MTQVVSDELERLAPEAVTEVFASYGVALTRVPLGESRVTVIPPLSVAISREATVAGFIGFSAPAVRGAVLLASTFNVIARARPPEARKKMLSASSSSDWILVRDWAGELVNQVLGRVKNRMRAVGLTFDVSAPAALSGQALNFAKPKSELTRPILFEAHPDRVWFWLDAQWSSDVELVAAPGRQRKEGDVILF
jgi:chemotaxis protein CheX